MVDLCKFQKEQRFVSYDGGITWSPLQEFRKGQLIEYVSPDCGSVGDMYRWVLIDNDFICVGKDKYTKLAYQVSHDGGLYWYNVFPSVFQAKDLVERNSDFCDNASEGHYSGETSHDRSWIEKFDPVWVVKCEESGTVLTYDVIHKNNQCLIDITITDCVIGIGDTAFENECISSITLPYSVTFIGDYVFRDCENLKEVYLPNTITSIGDGAFLRCSNIETISIPNQLTYLSQHLFADCNKLSNIIIPNSVTVIGDHAFSGCTSLSSITIPDSVTSIGSNAFNGCSLTSLSLSSAVTEIYYDSFAGSPITTLYTDSNASLNLGRRLVGNSLTSVVIGNNVSSIGDSAFANCGNLSSVTIGNSVTSIGDTAFAECSGLTSIVIPEGVISIGYGAFLQSHINHLIFPSSITTLGNVLSRYAEEYTLLSLVPPTIHRPVTNDGTFNGATIINVPCQSFGLYYEDTNYSSYKSILNPIGQCDNVRWVDDGEECISGSLYTRQVLEYRISEQSEWKATDRYRVTGSSIGDCHYKLTITDVQGNVSNVPCDENNYISSSDFNNYTNIKTVEIGACVTTISAKTFYNSSKTSGKFTAMTDVDMSEVQTIGASAFTNCASISSVTIPNGVSQINQYTFSGCTSLKYLSIPSSVTSIGNYAFNSCTGLTSVSIPSSVTSIGNGAFQYCSGLTEITIPNGVTSVGTSAFRYCSGLTSVTIPSSVTSIGGSAFSNCTGLTEIYYNAQCDLNSSFKGWGNALKKVVIGDSTPSIGSQAFSSCGSLSSVTIGSGVTSIGDNAFSNCKGLTSVTIPSGVTSIGSQTFYGCTSLTEVAIPDNVTSVGNGVFQNCSGLTTCTIGSGVTSISNSAFYNCSGLTSMTIGSGVTSIGGYAFYNCTSLTSLTVEATTPPTIPSSSMVFDNTNDCPIYVPAESVSTYKSRSGWRDYSSRIQAIP